MASKGKETGAAAQYARAVMQLANTDGQAEAVCAELQEIGGLVERDRMFAMLLRDPAIGEGTRLEMLRRVFQGRVAPLVWSLLGVLSGKKRLPLLLEIVRLCQEILDEQLGKVAVDLTVAHRLDEKLLAEVSQRISASLGKQAVVEQHEDESIIGGLVVQVEGRLIDGSVRAQLEAMRQRLLAAVPAK